MNIEMAKRFVQMQTPPLLMSGINMLYQCSIDRYVN